MNVNGDIIVIDDDVDDREIISELITEVLRENGYSNNVLLIGNSTKVVPYLHEMKESPFLIISDINICPE